MKYVFHIASIVVGACVSFQLAPSALSQTSTPTPPNPLQQEQEQLRQWLSDWAQLGFYQQANATLLLPGRDEQRVVFFGDSITQFWNLATYFHNQPYINRGIAGQTTPQLLVRFRTDVIALKPQAVLILAGTNDIAGNTGPETLAMIADNYTSIAELAAANHIRVIFASVLPIHDYSTTNRSENRPPDKIRALNDWLRRYCFEHHHIYLDYYRWMLDPRGMLKAELSNDGLHPNAQGYAVMAPLADAAIQQALRQSR